MEKMRETREVRRGMRRETVGTGGGMGEK